MYGIISAATQDPNERAVRDREDELSALEEYVEAFEQELGCKVEVIEAENSTIDKAKQAGPGKPAIYVE